MTGIADSIKRGLKEAIAHAEGTSEKHAFTVHVPTTVDVKAIRNELGMSQQEFAGCFGFSINTLRHWEQGTRVPEGSARAYLMVIARAPNAVQEALKAA